MKKLENWKAFLEDVTYSYGCNGKPDCNGSCLNSKKALRLLNACVSEDTFLEATAVFDSQFRPALLSQGRHFDIASLDDLFLQISDE